MPKLLLSLLLLSFSISAEVDPLEDFNRAMNEFNQILDKTLFKPITRSYKKSTPKTTQKKVNNFVGNLTDVGTFANQLLQFKMFASAATAARITLNSTVGIGGLFDVASDVGLKKNNEDFGQTMGVWGVETGPYVVLPVFGPSNFRDAVGDSFDAKIHPTQALSTTLQSGILLLGAVNTRAKLLPTTDLLEQSSEPYIAMRSSYLQKRKYDVFDGDVPFTDDEF